jgi:hypothetical protein
MAEVSGIGASTEPEIQRAITQLRHLVGSGNKAAAKRLTDIGQMCSVLEIQPGGSDSDSQSAGGLNTNHMATQPDSTPQTGPNQAWSGLDKLLAEGLDASRFGENQVDFSVHGLALDGTVATEWEQLETAACLFKAAGDQNWAGV